MPKASRAGARKSNQARQAGPPPSESVAPPVRPLHQSRELSPRMRTISLVVGDIICFLIFASLGTNQHGEGVNLLYSFWIALPFVAAWFVVSPFVGAFRADIATSPKRMFMRTILCWLATWPVAMALRWLQIDRVKTPPTPLGSFLAFAVVALLFNTALLLLWRWPFAANNNLRKRGV